MLFGTKTSSNLKNILELNNGFKSIPNLRQTLDDGGNKMKYILILALLLTGCYQSVNSNDIETAVKVCGSLEQVQEIRAHWYSEELVDCRNRTTHRLDNKAWTK